MVTPACFWAEVLATVNIYLIQPKNVGMDQLWSHGTRKPYKTTKYSRFSHSGAAGHGKPNLILGWSVGYSQYLSDLANKR
jgi:hypothetical protein